MNNYYDSDFLERELFKILHFLIHSSSNTDLNNKIIYIYFKFNFEKDLCISKAIFLIKLISKILSLINYIDL